MSIATNLRHDELDHRDHRGGADRPSAGRLSVRAPSSRSRFDWPALKAQRETRARQARDLQPAGLQLPARRQRRPRAERRRTRAHQHAHARRAARLDRLRGDDPRQQHLGRLARRPRRARHLPQSGEPCPGRQGAHGNEGGAARGHRRRAIRMGHVAAAALCRPGQPVADHRLRTPWAHGRARGAVQAEGRRAVLDHLGVRRCLRRVQRLPVGDRALLDVALSGAKRHRAATGERDGERAGALRNAAAGLSMRLGAQGLPRGTRVMVRITATDLLTLDVHASGDCSTAERCRRRRRRGCGRRRRSRNRRTIDACDRSGGRCVPSRYGAARLRRLPTPPEPCCERCAISRPSRSRC